MEVIDLHGLKHENVQKELDSFIWNCMQSNKKEIHIITGKSDQMKDIVYRCLSDYSIKPVESLDSGSLYATL